MKSLISLLWFITITSMSGIAASQPVDPKGRPVIEVAPALKTGQFVWTPEAAPAGSMLFIVNLDTQRGVLFRNGVPIAASTLSTGRPGYETPTGVFSVLQKQVEHYSAKYDNAPMPFMQRLTWRGVALHAGHLPGYAASHGCIRLPGEFARLLYGVTRVGMTVVITRLPAAPKLAAEPAMAAPVEAGSSLANAPFKWNPERAPRGLASVIVSAADRRAIVLRNGVEIGSAPVLVHGVTKGGWAYVLHRWDADGPHWLKLHFDGAAGTGTEIPAGEGGRFEAPDAFRSAVASVLAPGSIVVVTPEHLKGGNAGSPVTVIEDDAKHD